MTERQLSSLAVNIALRYKDSETIRRSDVIRDVVRAHKLSLDESIIVADCIVKGLYQSGKSIVLPAQHCSCPSESQLSIDCPVHHAGISAALSVVGL